MFWVGEAVNKKRRGVRCARADREGSDPAGRDLKEHRTRGVCVWGGWLSPLPTPATLLSRPASAAPAPGPMTRPCLARARPEGRGPPDVCATPRPLLPLTGWDASPSPPPPPPPPPATTAPPRAPPARAAGGVHATLRLVARWPIDVGNERDWLV